MKIGLFIGRFQPFHLGHLSAVKQALSQSGFLIIGIGSSQYSRTESNPFTAEERTKIIQLNLNNEGISEESYEIRLIPDIHDNEAWADHVKTIVPEAQMLFLANDGIVKELFEKHSPKTPITLLKNEIPLSASMVREKMKNGSNWQKDIKPLATQYIETILPTLNLSNLQ